MPERRPVPPQPVDDGTRQLLRSGAMILAVGIFAMAVLFLLLGGVGVEGAHNNMGWLALIVGMMCLPFGVLVTALGAAKWLRNRGQNRR